MSSFAEKDIFRPHRFLDTLVMNGYKIVGFTVINQGDMLCFWSLSTDGARPHASSNAPMPVSDGPMPYAPMMAGSGPPPPGGVPCYPPQPGPHGSIPPPYNKQ